MLGTLLKSDAFDALITWAVIPPARNRTPAPPATQAAVICHGRSALAGGVFSPVSFGGSGGAGGVVDGAGGTAATTGPGGGDGGALCAAAISLTTTRSF